MIVYIIFFCFLYVSKCQFPPLADDWDLENENPKYYNEKCKQDFDCYGSESSICHNGACDCKDNFERGLRFVGKDGVQVVCVRAPDTFEPCTRNCQKPAVCKLPETKNITYQQKYSISNVTLQVTGKICLCESPYKYNSQSYINCILDCEEHETYDSKTYKCVNDEKKKCTSENQILINGVCKPLVAIGKNCVNDSQCQNSFSECKNSKCICKANFEFKEGKCVPQTFKCLFGDALTKDKMLVSCKQTQAKLKCPNCQIKSDENTPIGGSFDVVIHMPPDGLPLYLYTDKRQFTNDCPSDYYCSVIYGENEREGSRGYCCPKVPLECPVGVALKNVSCDQLYNPTDEEYCPVKTHFCHFINGNIFQPKLCCPRPCSPGFVYVNGQCYQSVNIGDYCEVDGQCAEVKGKCTEGICQCPKNTKRIQNTCSPACGSDEIELNNECFPYFKLGDSCKADNRRCPSGTTCNKNYKCVCDTGAFPIGDECAPRTLADCSVIIDNKTIATKAYKMGVAEILNNATLCKIKNFDPNPLLSNVVEKCPADKYCRNYMRTAGICCPKPKPTCDVMYHYERSGVPLSNKTCNLTDDNSCGEGYVCHNYITRWQMADEDSVEGNICCPTFTKKQLLG